MTLVIAHQGDWLEAPGRPRPNTVDAVVVALRAGADGAEFDVRMTADGEVVMHHDSHIGDGDIAAGCPLPVGTAVTSVKREEVSHLSTLVELLEAVSGWSGEHAGASGPPVLNVELKDLPGQPGWDAAHTLARHVARLLVEAGVGEWPGPDEGARVRVIVSSFDPGALVELHREAPQLATGLLLAGGGDWRRALSQEGAWRAVHPEHVDADQGLFDAASAAGLAVVPWTVDDPARAVALASIGAAGIITNRPRSVLRALGR